MEDQVRVLRKKCVKASMIIFSKSASKENSATESCSCGKDRVIKLAPPTLHRHRHTIMIFIDAGVTHAQTVDTRPLFIGPGYDYTVELIAALRSLIEILKYIYIYIYIFILTDHTH